MRELASAAFTKVPRWLRLDGLANASPAERVMALSLPLVLALFFVASPALQRNVFYVTFVPAGLWFLARNRAPWRRVGRSPLMLAALLFVAWHPASMLWSPGWNAGTAFDEAKAAVTLAVFAVGVFHLLDSGKLDLDATLRGFAVTAGLSGVAAMVWHYGFSGMGETPLVGFGATDNPNIAATLYGVAALAALVYLLPRSHSVEGRASMLAVAAVCFAFVGLSESRAGLLALMVSLTASFLATRQRRLLAGLAAFVLLAGALALAGGIDAGRMLERGASYRFDLWAEALRLIAERPVLGHGVLADLRFEGGGTEFRSPHNLFLATQVFAGAPATLLLVLILALGTVQGWRLAQAGFPFAVSLLLLGAVAGFFDFRTLVDGLDRAWLVVWFPLVLTAALPRRDAATAQAETIQPERGRLTPP